ncbi:hypothetical protein [Sebaldella sp. S0638]|uniref:hypothetical protein n=1 Tax=Sebaldella sp. S0638 TaxID=2957809 RepID=UPI0020A11483|nr:hypothetical protein [Sebaldella sp. S0638]MCP1224074.1 hypothetical protein [Sebaldella sp. S0638]
MKKSKKDILNYPRKIIVRIAFIIILLSTIQETIRHNQIEKNFKSVREIAFKYEGVEEEKKLEEEERKKIQFSDTLNVSILILKLSCIIGALYIYDKKYFDNKEEGC